MCFTQEDTWEMSCIYHKEYNDAKMSGTYMCYSASVRLKSDM